MTELKEVRRRTQFLDHLRDRRINWELQQEDEPREMVKAIDFHMNIRKKCNLSSTNP